MSHEELPVTSEDEDWDDQRWGYLNGHFVTEDEALDIKFEEGASAVGAPSCSPRKRNLE